MTRAVVDLSPPLSLATEEALPSTSSCTYPPTSCTVTTCVRGITSTIMHRSWHRSPACRLGLSIARRVLCSVCSRGREGVAHSGGPFPSRHSNAEIRQSLLDGEGLGLPEDGARDRREWRERVGFEAAPSLCCSTGSLARAGHLGERDAGAPTDLDRALRSISRFLSLNLPTLSLPEAAGLVPISSSS